MAEDRPTQVTSAESRASTESDPALHTASIAATELDPAVHPASIAATEPARSKRKGVARVIRDFGPVGTTAAAPHCVLVHTGSEYIAKGAAYTPGHPYVAANELIVVRLAESLDLPVLDHKIIESNGQLFFGSAWMPSDGFYRQTSEDLFLRCWNTDVVYDLVAFDVWVCNRDRHHENLLVRKRGDGPDVVHTLLLNDHSECLLPGGRTPDQLPTLPDVSLADFIRLDFVKKAITDTGSLNAAIAKIERLEEETIRSIVREVPREMLEPAVNTLDAYGLIEGFLVGRRLRVRSIVRDGRSTFTCLDGGDI
jgi:hypothetical protein